MFSVIKAFFDCLTQGLKTVETKTEHGAQIYAISDAKKLQKASDIAEDIVLLFTKYKHCMSPADQRKLLRLIRQFKKCN